MASEKKNQDGISQNQKSRMITAIGMPQAKLFFSIQLTAYQANVINRLLPQNYVLCAHKVKSKRAARKTISLDKKEILSINDCSSKPEIELAAKQTVTTPIKTSQSYNNQQMIRKCQKILNMLKKNKYSWPFRQPVDPIALKIPQYFQVIKNPMDLSTINNNLLENRYQTITQFYADIQLIINNSLVFNKNNEQFLSLTHQFSRQFLKLKQEDGKLATYSNVTFNRKQTNTSSNTSLPNRKKSQNKPPIPPQMTSAMKLRKQLHSKMRTLARSQLLEVARSLNVQNDQQIDLQNLPQQKIQFLQDFFHNKKISQSQRAKQPTKKRNQIQQSSFESESDS